MVTMSKLEPAYSVIRKFDKVDNGRIVARGTDVLAHRLGLTRPAVLKWTLASEKSGTGGYIPHRYYDEILAYADEVGVSVDPSEFVVKPSQGAEAAA